MTSWYLHDPEEGYTEQAFAEALPTLAAMREEGLISRIGVGSKDVDVLTPRRAHRPGGRGHGLRSLHPARAARRGAAATACLDHEVEVVAVSVFNSGILSRPTVPDRAKYEYGDAPVDLLQRARELAALAVRYGVELPELAIRYPLRHPAISSVVLGMRTADQVRQNIERCLREIPEEIWEQIDA